MLINLETHGFFDSPLATEATILDLGAHRGAFAVAAKRRFGCRVVAVEPASDQINRLEDGVEVEVIQAAVTAEDGPVTLSVAKNPQASSVHHIHAERPGIEVPGLTYSSILAQARIETVDLLKVDIEGSEVVLFRSMSDEQLQAIPQITVELHDFNGMITSDESAAIVNRLRGLGFRMLPISRSNLENVLFWQPGLTGVGWLAEFWARYPVWLRLGLRRWWNRHRVSKK